jgi:hypothetical protein
MRHDFDHLNSLTIALSICAALALAMPAPAQSLIRSVPGPAANARYGKACIVVPDQNGDGFKDVLVGAPGFNGSRGAVYCLSGQYLATGTGPSELWSITAPPVNANAAFGTSLVSVGNLTGDAMGDFVVGAPGYRFNPASGITNGALVLVDGSTHTVAAIIYGPNNTALGEQLVSVGDQNGDGKTEFATNVRALITTSASAVYVMHGAAFSGTMSVISTTFSVIGPGPNEFGEALASGFDLDGDGLNDLAIGSPRMFAGNGQMRVVSADDGFFSLATYSGTAGEHMGASVGAISDYDGDGVVDFVVGAPNWSANHATEDGRAVVLSGAKLRSFTLPYELATYSLTQGGIATYHFGAEVCASPDLNRDGVGDFLIGAPDYNTTIPAGPGKGAVFVYSGATLTRLASIVGPNNDHLGDELLGAFQDVDGDLFPEFIVAGSLSDNPSADCGVVKLYRLFPITPSGYCVGKVNSLGCTPSMGFSGSPSASSASPFIATANSVINQKTGLLFYGHSPTAFSFQGGTLCVDTPLVRTLVQSSGGSTSGNDCSGAFAFDFNARIQSGMDPALVAGAEVFAQFWSRDPASPSTTSLSNALRFVINP